ncbi:MAG: DUF6111 family protein [Pseudomonadota bacterium]
MIRVVLINLLFFLIPFVAYAAYLFLRKGRFNALEEMSGRTFYWLIGSGAACVVVGLVLLATFQTGSPNAVYEPARYEDGVLKPGGFRTPDDGERQPE